ncbi:hypothetical protein [Cerasicoccus fimbriatus]|uniref:hypothetical protein n=1 Tax=Cerasicoccus fimbriatus TaxID=3014554 RepID=UPI0022B2C69C|nr:hypothetical protein [Cerasicoccus sp. TK19100]
MRRFFNGTFPSLLDKLDAHVARAQERFADNDLIESLILGGGYGRGEGGVYLADDEPQLYNDLDYFLFTSEPENPELLREVRDFEKVESAALGIDVEVTCLPPGNLNGAEKSMMFHDLVKGCLVVTGPQNYLAEWQDKMDPALIAPIEATRLLWNRGSGLFFARCRLDEPDARGFIYRQHMKLAIALGDAILCMAGQHNAYCEIRGERFAQLDSPLATDEIRALHATGVAFKQRPEEPPADLDLAAQNAQMRALWQTVYINIEGKRLGCAFENADDYAKSARRLFPEESALRCLLLAVRDRLKRGAALRPYGDYPRGALMRALVQLNADQPDWDQVKQNLPIKNTDWKSTSSVYETWWNYYS